MYFAGTSAFDYRPRNQQQSGRSLLDLGQAATNTPKQQINGASLSFDRIGRKVKRLRKRFEETLEWFWIGECNLIELP